ncbi:hypothetical protein KAW55_07485, partial [bacterium]|nr:hypothetical protein [bacterium]
MSQHTLKWPGLSKEGFLANTTVNEKIRSESQFRSFSPHFKAYPHSLHALLDRIPMAAVQKQVGHKRLATTQIYSNLAPEQVREAYEK